MNTNSLQNIADVLKRRAEMAEHNEQIERYAWGAAIANNEPTTEIELRYGDMMYSAGLAVGTRLALEQVRATIQGY